MQLPTTMSCFWGTGLFLGFLIPTILAAGAESNLPGFGAVKPGPSTVPANQHIFSLFHAPGLFHSLYAKQLIDHLRSPKYNFKKARAQVVQGNPLTDEDLLAQIEPFTVTRRFIKLSPVQRLTSTDDGKSTRTNGWALALPAYGVERPSGTNAFAILSAFKWTPYYENKPTLWLHGYVFVHKAPLAMMSLSDMVRGDHVLIEDGDALATGELLHQIQHFQ